MAMTLDEFILKSGGELVGGRIVVGVQGDRIVVGDAEPVFVLNEDGQALLTELEAGVAAEPAVVDVATNKRRKAAGATGPATLAQATQDAAPAA